jgi:hypothetical protein
MALKWSGPWYGAVCRWAKDKLLNQRRLVLSGMHGHARSQAKWYLRPATGSGRKPAAGALDTRFPASQQVRSRSAHAGALPTRHRRLGQHFRIAAAPRNTHCAATAPAACAGIPVKRGSSVSDDRVIAISSCNGKEYSPGSSSRLTFALSSLAAGRVVPIPRLRRRPMS